MHSNARPWLIRWMYVIAIAHLAIGAALPWIEGMVFLEGYHQRIETAFWDGVAPAAARTQQEWWMALFGATIQNLALWMFALTRLGDRYRNPTIWTWMIAGLLLWAPQDIAISLRVGIWSHVWIDLLALGLMLPALIWLHRLDKYAAPSPHLQQERTA